jgi:predicted amidohydrolase
VWEVENLRTMTRTIRVAAVQLQAHDRDAFARTLDAIVAAADEAAATARLVVLPEGTFPSYVLGDEPVDAVAVDAALDRLRDVARRRGTTIVAGAAIRSHDSPLPYNAAVAIDRDGSIAGHADKLFLWHFDRRWFSPGEHLEPVGTSIGRLGMLVCADGRLPTIARTLVDRGAELLVMPTAWVTSGRNPRALENVQADLLARVRAYENGVPFVAANKCGAELGMVAYCGKSQAVDANGTVVAMAGELEPETVRATLEIGNPHPHRAPEERISPRKAPVSGITRIAVTPDPLPHDIGPRLELLEDAYAIAPGLDPARRAALEELPAAFVGDECVLDPAGLAAYRRAGYALAVWETHVRSSWTQPLARSRALELRMYVVVIDRGGDRAFAVDPDGAPVAGTFDGYRLASFALDWRKTADTGVAPGTDVEAGLQRIAGLAPRQDEVSA